MGRGVAFDELSCAFGKSPKRENHGKIDEARETL